MTDNRREALDRNRKANFKIPNSNINKITNQMYIPKYAQTPTYSKPRI